MSKKYKQNKSNLKDDNSYQRMTDSGVSQKIVEFPKMICLEQCKVDITKGYEKDVIETLKAFSDKNSFMRKNPHPLYKDNTLNHHFQIAKSYDSKVYSLDVKSRNDKYRLLYCIDKNKIHKILALCTDDTHDG